MRKLLKNILPQKYRESMEHPIFDQILQQWDFYDKEGNFPHFNTNEYWAFGKSCLSAFRTEDEWLTIFEMIIYRNGLLNFDTLIYAYGNKVSRPGVQTIYWTDDRIDFIRRLKMRRLERPFESNPDQEWCPEPFDFQIKLNGIIQGFQLQKNDYLAAGINLDKPISGDKCLDQIINVLRVTCHYVPPDQLFLPDDLLLEYVNRPKLNLFMRLYEWCHPGLGSILYPSESQCLRRLAKALSDNEINEYKCDPNLINTHWSHWPQFSQNWGKSIR